MKKAGNLRWLKALVLVAAAGRLSGGAVVINEIHFDPDIKTEPVEFIELHNPSGAAVSLEGWSVTRGVSFAFPPGSKIEAGGYLVVAENPAAMQRKFGFPAVGPWTGSLANEGERIVLANAAGETVDEVRYKLGFPWPTVGDAPGHSIELVNASLDNDLGGNWRSSASPGPTPGRRNSVFALNIPPQVRQVEHAPNQPASGQAVRITAKITDADGVASVVLLYQRVDPGQYIELSDAAYRTAWTSVPMTDDGRLGDALAGDGIYTVELPGILQTHRRLVRYRITASDSAGQGLTVPYPDDPQPNFAYFVYDGIPAWPGAIQPSSADPVRRNRVRYDPEALQRLPVYHVLAKAGAVEAAQYGGYTGSEYRWLGTLVHNGRVYDHIRHRARGGVWRYAMGKNMWKFDFNRGHAFQALDNFGREYKTSWTKLNLGACIQQGDYLHRGEQGMFESVGFRLFNLAGVEAPLTHFVHFRVIDDRVEADPSNQYAGDFWGLYLAVEQMDGRFLDEHGLADGNLYKMERGTGELNNQGPTAATDKSDLNAFVNGYSRTATTDTWWRTTFDLDRYYSYQAIVQGIHHYDICYGKNFFYYLNPETRKWSVHPWDLDLTWADNMYDANCGGTDEFKNRVLNRAAFNLEFKNRVREIRDLLFNPDQANALIDEYAGIIDDPGGGPAFVDADRALWDYHPILASSKVLPNKAGQGRFYQIASTKDFSGMVRKMKEYVVLRGRVLDNLAHDPMIPAQPGLSYAGPSGYPANRLRFRATEYSGTHPIAAMKWRLGEVTPADRVAFDPQRPRKYEMESVWDSGELPGFSAEAAIPAGLIHPGLTYRARVRMKDSTGRWSRWSDPLEFTAQEPDTVPALRQYLRISEIMYHPPSGSLHEFLELHNASSTEVLDLSGAEFTQGIQFSFPSGTTIQPRGYLLIVQAAAVNNFAEFRAHYGLEANVAVLGPFSGNLSNAGERITLSLAGQDLLDIQYGDDAPWPVQADGRGASLQLIDASRNGQAQPDWRDAQPTPGRGLEGQTPQSAVKWEKVQFGAGTVTLQFVAETSRAYVVEYRDSLTEGSWKKLADVPPRARLEMVEFVDPAPGSNGARFYRLVTSGQ